MAWNGEARNSGGRGGSNLAKLSSTSERRSFMRSRLTSSRGSRYLLRGHFRQDLRQAVELARPDDQVNVSGAAEDQVLVLLRHAAQDADDGFRPSLFQRTQAAQGAIDLVFGMLPHAARVVEDGVGVARTIDQFVARLDKAGNDQFAVQHVHLAADSLDVHAFGHGEWYSVFRLTVRGYGSPSRLGHACAAWAALTYSHFAHAAHSACMAAAACGSSVILFSLAADPHQPHCLRAMNRSPAAESCAREGLPAIDIGLACRQAESVRRGDGPLPGGDHEPIAATLR